MSTKLHRSTNVFIIADFVIYTMITMGSSWYGWNVWKSSSINVIGGMLLFRETEYPIRVILTCLFVIASSSPRTLTSFMAFFSSFHPFIYFIISFFPSFPIPPLFCSGLLPFLGIPSSLMKRFNCSTWNNSYIRSFSATHSFVWWPWLMWYWKCLLWSTRYGVRVFLGVSIICVVNASCSIQALLVLNGVYCGNFGPQGTSLILLYCWPPSLSFCFFSTTPYAFI